MSVAQRKTEGRLAGIRILLAEDEALIAMDIEHTLMEEGATLVAPAFASYRRLMEQAGDVDIDIAILDVALSDGMVFPAADLLKERGIPLAFHSGHAMQDDISARFPGCGWIVKPSHPAKLVDTVAKLVHSQTR